MPEFVIAVLDGGLAASVGATLDVLDFANRAVLGSGRSPLRWRVLGSHGQARLSNGLRLPCQRLVANMDLGDAILIVPGLGLNDPTATEPADLAARYAADRVGRRLACPDAQRLADLAHRHQARGGQVAASCSGVLVLGEAGLLDGRRVTTHWALAALLRRRYPQARLDPACMVVEDAGIVTAGAALAQLDLMLHLLRRQAGRAVAETVMRHLLIDHRTTQARYLVWQTLDDDVDDTLRRFEALIEASLPATLGVAAAARRLNLTPKTLTRRITRSTGGPPRRLIQAIRMRQAQRLLDTTDLPVEEIAARVGYANATSLRKLTVKMTRLTPALLRQAG